jgi:hypothetical protein
LREPRDEETGTVELARCVEMSDDRAQREIVEISRAGALRETNSRWIGSRLPLGMPVAHT